MAPQRVQEETARTDKRDRDTELSRLLESATSPAVLNSDFVPNRKFRNNRNSNQNLWSLVAPSVAGLLVGLVVVLAALWSRQNYNVNDPNDRHGGSSTMSKYTKVQGIGFQIYTGGAHAFLDHGSNDGYTTANVSTSVPRRTIMNPECVHRASYGTVVGDDHPEMRCYMGHENATVDVDERVRILRDAVERAYAQADANSTTLKIFVAPEFYWRGIDGAYLFEEEAPSDPSICGPVCRILQSLETFVAQGRFEDWLFVFGTVVASDSLPTKDPYDYLFYNFAPIYKGYDPLKSNHEGKRFLVPKRYVSSSDFLTPQRNLDPSLYKELVGHELPQRDTTVYNPFDFDRKRYDYDLWETYKEELNTLGYAMIEYDWLIMDGLSMTMEICFDHQMRTALSSYMGDMVTGRTTLIPSSSDDDGLQYVHIPTYQAQISIVSSAGMTIVPESLALTNSGVIFLQDGLSNETNRMYWGVEGCELGLQFDGGTEAVTRKAFLSATDVVFEHKALDTFKRYDLYAMDDYEEKINGSFSAKVYPPQVLVFDTVEIAEVTPS